MVVLGAPGRPLRPCGFIISTVACGISVGPFVRRRPAVPVPPPAPTHRAPRQDAPIGQAQARRRCGVRRCGVGSSPCAGAQR